MEMAPTTVATPLIEVLLVGFTEVLRRGVVIGAPLEPRIELVLPRVRTLAHVMVARAPTPVDPPRDEC